MVTSVTHRTTPHVRGISILVGGMLLVLGPILLGVEAPADGVLDDTHALGTAAHRAIAAEIASLHADLRADIWLAATSFPPSAVTPRQQARSTRGEWSGDSSALFIGYDRASNSISLSFSPQFWERYPSSSLVELMRDSGRMIADKKLTVEERLLFIVHELAERLRQLETVRIQHDRWFQQGEKRFAFMLMMALLGATLVAAVLGIVSRRRARSHGEQHYFPDVAVGSRLGAAFGGGLIAEATRSPEK